ncbi:hypothetical protein D6D00_08214, partial [Aureobasidium pullulans]
IRPRAQDTRNKDQKEEKKLTRNSFEKVDRNRRRHDGNNGPLGKLQPHNNTNRTGKIQIPHPLFPTSKDSKTRQTPPPPPTLPKSLTNRTTIPDPPLHTPLPPRPDLLPLLLPRTTPKTRRHRRRNFNDRRAGSGNSGFRQGAEGCRDGGGAGGGWSGRGGVEEGGCLVC